MYPHEIVLFFALFSPLSKTSVRHEAPSILSKNNLEYRTGDYFVARELPWMLDLAL
jgi:hypothetical protein